jgi:nitrous oxide reductase accessory protein NosL
LSRIVLSSLAFLMVSMFFACSSGEGDAERAGQVGAMSLAGAEGAVCGMVVSEQPAPRAQVVHRDGTHLYLCGIADLLLHLEARSPHGEPVEIYVEVMEPDEDPREILFAEHEWVRAENATSRIGDERPRLIMGEPVMVYRDRPTAERAVAHGPTTILDFDELRAWWRNRQL